MMKKKPGVVIHRPVVWVTGASRGIGGAVAAEFASIGCEVCLSGRSARALQPAVRAITSAGGRAYVYPCDITDRKAVFSTVRAIKKDIGEVDILVNNAGITTFKSFLQTSLEECDDIIATNLIGQLACAKAVLPSMVRRKSGWIFNILSHAAVKIFTDSSAYSAAKAGLRMFGKVLREELKSQNIRVVNVLPGATATEMWSAGMRRKHSHRMMRPESVGEMVLALYRMPPDLVVDEIIVRPMMGDIE